MKYVEEIMAATYTPMIQQYLSVKADYQDAFLFFRLGDFYEMFFEDAISASRELEITLTSRDGGAEDRIPMCGVPYHSAPNYIERLIEKGYKVAICEQTEDPKQAKGVVKREVVQLITPGTRMEGKGLNEKENNYIATVTAFEDDTYGFAYSDLSTGETKATIITDGFTSILNELSVSNAKEIVVSSQFSDKWLKKMKERMVLTISIEDDVQTQQPFEESVSKLANNRLRDTVMRLYNYLYKTQKRSLDHLQLAEVYEVNQFMKIDYFSKKNLELTETMRSNGKKGSLLWLLDETKTAMGSRMLKQWIDRPLINKDAIIERQSMVETFMNHYFEREELRDTLKEVYDLERLAGRVAFGNVNARDLFQLQKSLQQVPKIGHVVNQLTNDVAKKLASELDPCEDVTDLLERAIAENPR